jgi:hypothetical protein
MPTNAGPTNPAYGQPGYGNPGTRSPNRTTKASFLSNISSNKKRSNRKGGRK